MVSLQLCLPSLDAHSANGHIRVNQGRGRCLSGASHHQAIIKPTSSQHPRKCLGGYTEDVRYMLGRERSKLPTETSLNCLVISQALLPSFSRLTHAFGKGLPSSWSLLGLGKYLATPWVELGYTLGKAWVYRICTLGVPCQKRTTTKIDSRSSRIQEGQHHDC